MAKVKGLTQKQKVFIYEYLLDFNGTRAAIAAGYPRKSASSVASENLTKPEILKYIKDFQKSVEERSVVTQQMIINELARYAFRGVAGSYGTITDARESIAALEKLGQHLGMWKNAGPTGSGTNQDARKNALNRVRDYLVRRNNKQQSGGGE